MFIHKKNRYVWLRDRLLLFRRNASFQAVCHTSIVLYYIPGTALYEVESPVIAWVQGSGTGIVFVVLRRRILGGNSRKARAWFQVSVSVVHERNKAALLLSPTKQTSHVSTTEYRLNKQTCPGIQNVPHALILTIARTTSFMRPNAGYICSQYNVMRKTKLEASEFGK